MLGCFLRIYDEKIIYEIILNFSSETFTSVHFVSNNFIYYHTGFSRGFSFIFNIKINEKPLENPVW